MSNLDDFIIHSQYPVQKVVWAYEGTFEPSNPYWKEEIIGGLPYDHLCVPLPASLDLMSLLLDGVWTIDDWQTSYPMNTLGRIGGMANDGGGWSLKSEYGSASFWFENGTSWVVSLVGGSDYGGTIRFRVWAYLKESDWQSGATEKTSSTLAQIFQKNTNLAQLNMVAEVGKVLADGETWTYYHNLGFTPLVKFWARTPTDSRQTPYGIADETFTAGRISFVVGITSLANDLRIDSQKIEITSHRTEYSEIPVDYLMRIYNYGTAL